MAALTPGVVARAKPGNSVSGDAWRLLESAGRCLLVMADGLGSGPAAHEASERAVAVVAEQPERSLLDHLDACHQRLRGTRGAAVGVLAISPGDHHISFAGLGNVEVRTGTGSNFKPVATNGIVGHNYRPPRVYEAEYRPGELLVMHTDGLSTRFDLDQQLRSPFETEQELAERLAAEHAREHDDLAIVVLRLP